MVFSWSPSQSGQAEGALKIRIKRANRQPGRGPVKPASMNEPENLNDQRVQHFCHHYARSSQLSS